MVKKYKKGCKIKKVIIKEKRNIKNILGKKRKKKKFFLKKKMKKHKKYKLF